MKKSGFIAIIGETNAGKSTLLNLLVQSKVSIVSHKVQTTRNNILGVLTQNNSQLVFIDTPGIFSANREFDKQMIKASYSSIAEADIVMVIIDANKGITNTTKQIIQHIPSTKKQVLLINKMDLLSKEKMFNLLQQANSLSNFNQFFVVSATKNKGVDLLLKYLFSNVPQADWLFLEDDLSNQSLQQMATEITREKIYEYVHQELPYNIAVEHDKWEETSNKVTIYQTINVAKASYKPILLGEKASKIKSIRMASQQNISKLVNKKVSLFLHVKVNNKWLLG